MSREKSNEEALLFFLEKLLLKLDEISNRLARVEYLLKSRGLSSAENLSGFLAIVRGPLHSVLESLVRAWRVLFRVGRVDSITESVIYVLSTCRAQSISGVYREVKKLRGRASRRVIAQKLRVLEISGIVVNTGSPRRPKYTLRECLEEMTR
jgi:hypothetical protein